ncbi:cobalamin-5'-phosphate synthase [Phyllobacterium sp. YR620]|uniref:adenosylcobinamide-GDP ribazoletransferase n=1 Tax=Phyllobacterium sp. YR620 TaxID=1881066 RepID=UPI000891D24F|nr:adenosylcobinamide-GDP ribazoletransferase [Phyllobacterium sp. YR620]SDP00745.1 cobalamin-5'-phosphate synthase [Phyllobacterium sp. YR620]
MDLLNETMRALAFLSRLPVSSRWFRDYDGALASSVRGFPLAGIIIALPAALVLLVTSSLPAFASALLVTAVLAVTTGALHEDGLADVADGFYGGNSPQRRLEIMRDSAIGSYGTLALIFSVLLRTALLATVIGEVGSLQALAVLIGTEAASRAALAKFWQSLPSARPGGVADRAGVPTTNAANSALAIGGVVLAVGYGFAAGILAVIAAGALATLVFFGFAALCRAKIGGQTGDTLGALQQFVSISLLLGLVIVL